MTVSPGRGARRSSTSSARTGTWSVSVGKTLGNIFRAPFGLRELLAPRGAIPDLEMVVDARDRHLALDARTGEELGRDHHPSLLVELDRRGGREEVALHGARLGPERIER